MTSHDRSPNPRRLRILERRLARLTENGTWFRVPFWKRSALLRKIHRLAGPKPAAVKLAIIGAAALGLAACPKPATPVPDFAAAVQNPFGLAAVAAPAAPAFADIDGDGDFDLFAGAGGENSGVIAFFENTGTHLVPSFATPTDFSALPATGSEISGGPVPVFAPLLDAGQMDMVIGHSWGYPDPFSLFEEDAGSFIVTPVPIDLASLSGGYALTAAMVDIDGDNLVDAVVSATTYDGYQYVNTMSFYKNTGTQTAPEFTDQTTDLGLVIPSGSYAYPAFVDIDADGDFDAFAGDEYGDIWFFANTGTSTAPAFAPAISLPFGLEAVPNGPTVLSFIDIDDDGDFDLFVGDGNGDFWFFENTMF
jgi:hypothetical protein